MGIRFNNRKWGKKKGGLGVVIGKDGKTVVIKHGGLLKHVT